SERDRLCRSRLAGGSAESDCRERNHRVVSGWPAAVRLCTAETQTADEGNEESGRGAPSVDRSVLMAPFRVEPLARSHDRSRFDCGVAPLNRYFANQVGQDVRRRVTACFVTIETSTGNIAGYYTLSAGSVALTDLPEQTAKKL